ncbi:protein ABHD13-like [Copidosoma floridanum]|uniref:protein ABHD13-like n=1 Tax=Copidosoma floridanum TaxID=29053 RepID=UPI000C6FA093|nr:protein ABHD13-like [Copidosoma floridanum]
MAIRLRLSRIKTAFRLVWRVSFEFWVSLVVYFFVCYLLYWLYGTVVAFLLICCFSVVVLYFTEDSFLYYPQIPSNSRIFVPLPSMYNLPFENIYTKSIDETFLHMYFISQPDHLFKKCPTLLFFHGNSGNIGHRFAT